MRTTRIGTIASLHGHGRICALSTPRSATIAPSCSSDEPSTCSKFTTSATGETSTTVFCDCGFQFQPPPPKSPLSPCTTRQPSHYHHTSYKLSEHRPSAPLDRRDRITDGGSQTRNRPDSGNLNSLRTYNHTTMGSPERPLSASESVVDEAADRNDRGCFSRRNPRWSRPRGTVRGVPRARGVP